MWWPTHDEFTYEVTEHLCPECETPLTNPVPSSMLVCNEGHGPYFLV